jgi:ribose 1,5-bisphosphokinase PhnN
MAKKQELQKEMMTTEQAITLRASKHVISIKPLNQKQKREAFKTYWTANKKKYGLTNKIEEIIWLHLVSTNNDSPEKFEDGIKNFGIKKV